MSELKLQFERRSSLSKGIKRKFLVEEDSWKKETVGVLITTELLSLIISHAIHHVGMFPTYEPSWIGLPKDLLRKKPITKKNLQNSSVRSFYMSWWLPESHRVEQLLMTRILNRTLGLSSLKSSSICKSLSGILLDRVMSIQTRF